MKNLLDVADNLERAAASVPDEHVGEASEIDRDRALSLLRSLRDGVLMTDTVLMKVCAGHGSGACTGTEHELSCSLEAWSPLCKRQVWVDLGLLPVAAYPFGGLQVCSTVIRPGVVFSIAVQVGCAAQMLVTAALIAPTTRLLPAAAARPQVLAQEGVTRYDPLNEAFDPNLHNALFEVPDATKEPGTVAVVVKVRRGRLCWGRQLLGTRGVIRQRLQWPEGVPGSLPGVGRKCNNRLG